MARATGYSEMLSHEYEWLTDERAVQRARIANGGVVTVIFGDTNYENEHNQSIPPLGFRIDGMQEA